MKTILKSITLLFTLCLITSCNTTGGKYLGDNDECHAAYHFPLMPMIFKSIAASDSTPIKYTMSSAVTPEIGNENQWFTFLRVHDELSLELVYVSEEDRKFIHNSYCHNPQWDFRVGEGISARLSELMEKDINKIGLAYSIMLTLTGTPVVYYGDEFGKLNDEAYYQEQIKLTGKDDTRFLVRGRIDWQELEQNLKDEDSFHNKVYILISSMLNTRKDFSTFGRGSLNFIDSTSSNGSILDNVLTYERVFENQKILVINNLSDKTQYIKNPLIDSDLAVLNMNGFTMDDEILKLESHGFVWLMVVK